jgi:hypothetical protein
VNDEDFAAIERWLTGQFEFHEYLRCLRARLQHPSFLPGNEQEPGAGPQYA